MRAADAYMRSREPGRHQRPTETMPEPTTSLRCRGRKAMINDLQSQLEKEVVEKWESSDFGSWITSGKRSEGESTSNTTCMNPLMWRRYFKASLWSDQAGATAPEARHASSIAVSVQVTFPTAVGAKKKLVSTAVDAKPAPVSPAAAGATRTAAEALDAAMARDRKARSTVG